MLGVESAYDSPSALIPSKKTLNELHLVYLMPMYHLIRTVVRNSFGFMGQFGMTNAKISLNIFLVGLFYF